MLRFDEQKINFDKPLPVGEIAIKTLIFALFYYPIYFYAWLLNLDSIKSTILFIVALGLTGWKVYRDDITKKQNKKLKDLQIRREEMDEMERRLQMQEKKIELEERMQRLKK